MSVTLKSTAGAFIGSPGPGALTAVVTNTGIVVERERLDKFGRPLLGATIKLRLASPSTSCGMICGWPKRGYAGD
jgi:hypothetical protein